jgi:hypothetical protein
MSEKKNPGPVTKKGKAHNSKNAIKHGLTSLEPSTFSDHQLVQNFIVELNNYYQPDSPLEKLQIERIALCRAKLARLYQVEQTKLKIYTLEQSEPNKVLDSLNIGGLTKGMVREIIEHKELTLPCGIPQETFNQIVAEITDFSGTLKVQADLEENFPILVQFLTGYRSIKKNYPDRLEQQLAYIVTEINKSMDHGDKYSEVYRDLIELIEFTQAEKKLATKSEEEDELDQLIRRRQEERDQQRLKAIKQQKTTPKDPQQEDLVHGNIMHQLRTFQRLQEEVLQAHEHYKKYLERKDLIEDSITLPEKESDLFLRYQSNWERRLSSAMGEFLALQKQKL